MPWETNVPQLDLIIETYVHAPAPIVASAAATPEFERRLWRDWQVRATEHRGDEGVRWELVDVALRGSCEVWVQRLRPDGCLLHTFVRVDPNGRPWSSRRAARRRRRARARLSRELWAFKDDVEAQADGVCR